MKKPQATLPELIQAAIRDENTGDLKGAEAAYQGVLARDNRQIDAYLGLGRIYTQRKLLPEAIRAFKAALKIAPDNYFALANMGSALRLMGDLEGAIDALQKAKALNPAGTGVHVLLGLTHKDQGNLPAAETILREAVLLTPLLDRAWNSLGIVLGLTGKYQEAESCFLKATQIAPRHHGHWANLAAARDEQEKTVGAVSAYRHALALRSDDGALWAAYARLLKKNIIGGDERQLTQELLTCFARDDLDHQNLFQNAVALVRPQSLWPCPSLEDLKGAAKIKAYLDTPLAKTILRRCINTDSLFEKVLAKLRREFLMCASLKSDWQDLVEALAAQCWSNEYIFVESEEETERIFGLIPQIEKNPSPILATVLACYRPLNALPSSIQASTSVALRRQQIEEPMKEKILADQLPSLTEISVGVSAIVRDQYEVNPYPRWQAIDQAPRDRFQNRILKLLPMLTVADLPIANGPHVLIAGCGTGRHALETAIHFGDADLMAFDLSRASLSYAARKADELQLSSIKFAHGDILKLANYPERFDVIESTGVLHHLEHPVAGWKVLRNLLKPRGLMRIALYSRTARQHLSAAQAIMEQNNLEADTVGIRQLRQHILALADTDPLKRVSRSEDFYSLSGSRDLLCHVQEHQVDLNEVASTLKNLNLVFRGFEFPTNKSLAAYHQVFPQDRYGLDLESWARYEASYPTVFAGMYQFWCQASN